MTQLKAQLEPVNARLERMVAEAFAPRGWLVGEGFHYLPQQEAYAHHVSRWLGGAADKPAGVIEASTGIGKSIGYLLPVFCWAALTGKRIAISTFTINLQRQLMRDDIKLAQRYLQSMGLLPLRIGHFLGRNNYLNKRRIENLLIGLGEGTLRDGLHNLLSWSQAGADGTLQGFVEQFGDELSEREICMQSNDDDSESPVFQAHRAAIPRADVIVTSHAVSILNAAARMRSSGGAGIDILPALDAIVFDEADRLESAASFLQKRLALNHLHKVIETVLREVVASGSPHALKVLLVLLKAIDDLNGHLMELPGANTAQPLLAAQFSERTKQMISHLAVALKRALAHPSLTAIATCASELQQLMGFDLWLERFTQADSNRYCGVMWSQAQQLPSLYEYRLDPQSILSRDIRYRHNDAAACRQLFTSATLSDANASHALRFKAFWARLKIKSELVCCEFSCAPSQFGAMRFVLAAADAPAPFNDYDVAPQLNPAWLDYCALLLTRVSQYGPVLVLTNSYEEAACLSERMVVPHLTHRRGTKLGALLAAFQQQQTMLLTPAAWEGVSLRRADGTQLFRELVITRLPYARTSDEELAALRAVARERRGATTPESVAFTRRTNEVKRKLQQGMGRGIRAASDTCRVWIADPRFPHPGAVSTFSSLRSAIPERFWRNYEAAEFFTCAATLENCPERPAINHAVAVGYL